MTARRLCGLALSDSVCSGEHLGEGAGEVGGGLVCDGGGAPGDDLVRPHEQGTPGGWFDEVDVEFQSEVVGCLPGRVGPRFVACEQGEAGAYKVEGRQLWGGLADPCVREPGAGCRVEVEQHVLGGR